MIAGLRYVYIESLTWLIEVGKVTHTLSVLNRFRVEQVIEPTGTSSE